MNDFERPAKNPHFFYDKNNFPFLQTLEAHFDIIKKEFLDLQQKKTELGWLNTFPGYVSSNTKKAWQVFSFSLFCMRFTSNARLCPQTAELIFSIPQIISSNYSHMKPHTHILPHKGYSRMQLRCHLPLIVPNEELCALRVGDTIHHWREGQLVIFDDSYEHEAWNKTNLDRVVLMFDVPNPLWGYTAEEISKYKLERLDDDFLLSLASKEKWLEGFEKKVAPIE